MSELLRSPKAKIGTAVGGGLLMIVAVWFLLVAPQRAKANDLSAQVSAARAELSQRKIALANPSTNVTVKPSDIYRLTKAMPNETDMAGILVDIDRLARTHNLEFDAITPSPQVLGTGYIEQPLALTVQGRFGDVSRFLGDLRKLVSVHAGRLDARGRLYSVSQINISAPESGKTFPIVKAALTLNAYSFSAPSPSSGTSPTTTGASPSGTVAAGVTP
jgi:hypothetical protein